MSANDFENKDKQELQIAANNFVPTIFHQNVEITSAYIETRIYDEAYSKRNSETLYITEKYRGDDTKLNDFERTYRFTLVNNSDWVYSGFSGIANYTGPGYSREYLPLKKSN